MTSKGFFVRTYRKLICLAVLVLISPFMALLQDGYTFQLNSYDDLDAPKYLLLRQFSYWETACAAFEMTTGREKEAVARFARLNRIAEGFLQTPSFIARMVGYGLDSIQARFLIYFLPTFSDQALADLQKVLEESYDPMAHLFDDLKVWLVVYFDKQMMHKQLVASSLDEDIGAVWRLWPWEEVNISIASCLIANWTELRIERIEYLRNWQRQGCRGKPEPSILVANTWIEVQVLLYEIEAMSGRKTLLPAVQAERTCRKDGCPRPYRIHPQFPGRFNSSIEVGEDRGSRVDDIDRGRWGLPSWLPKMEKERGLF